MQYKDQVEETAKSVGEGTEGRYIEIHYCAQ